MKLLILLLLPALIILACSSPNKNDRSANEVAPPGSMSFFDTVSGTYKISSEDKKLINTWESFTKALVNADSALLRSFFADSIYCPYCLVRSNDEPGLIGADEFYHRFANDIFNSNLLSRMIDNSRVKGYYVVDHEGRPDGLKRAEIFVSYPLREGQYEGSSDILIFDETKSGYKFSGIWMMP